MIKTSFSEASTEFKDFLSSQSLSTDLICIFAEDVVWRSDLFWINPTSIAANSLLANEFFKKARERDLGVRFDAQLLIENKIGYAINMPADEIDAEYIQYSEDFIKYSRRNPLEEARFKEFSVVDRIIKPITDRSPTFFSPKILFPSKRFN